MDEGLATTADNLNAIFSDENITMHNMWKKGTLDPPFRNIRRTANRIEVEIHAPRNASSQSED